MNREEAQAWLDAYVAAWKSYDRDAVAALFAEDVEYRFHPYEEPARGRDAAVDAWMGEGDHEGRPDRDPPGCYDAEYSPVAIDGNVVVATGRSTYTESDGSPGPVFENCFVIRFDESGRCREFTEWFMEHPTRQ